MTSSTTLAIAALILTACISTSESRSPSPKRGYVADGCTGSACPDFSLLTSVSWFYDYNYPDPYCGNATTCATSQQFVPMTWCISDTSAYIPPYVNTSLVHGFNEPNNVHNCNKSPTEVAQAWKDVMARFPNSKLVSPATAGDGTTFFDGFFAACKQLYGASGCNISYVAVHDYTCDAGTTMSYLKKINQKYGYPVILSEFSCGDGAEGKPTSDQLAFMKDIVPMLDAADYVFRYSWMSAHDPKGLRGLVDSNGQLTSVGQLYNSL